MSIIYFDKVSQEKIKRYKNQGENDAVGFGGNKQLGDFRMLLEDAFSSREMGFGTEYVTEIGFRGFLILVELLAFGRRRPLIN